MNVFWIVVVSLVIVGFCVAIARDMNNVPPSLWEQRERR